MKVFPCAEIALDAQGGGIAIMEALHDPDKIREGEVPIWPTINDKKEKDTENAYSLCSWGHPSIFIITIICFWKYFEFFCGSFQFGFRRG